MAQPKRLRIGQFDPQWCLPSKLTDNPLVRMLQVNGIIVDVRMMPKEFKKKPIALG